METQQKETLQRNHVRLVRDLEPRGHVLDCLHGDGVLTENDCERIQEAPSRRERCQLLLHLIPTRGPAAYGAFQRALHASSHEFLAQLLDTDANDQNSETVGDANRNQQDCKSENRHRDTGSCKKCDDFITGIVANAGDERDSEIVRLVRKFGCLILDNVEPIDVVDQIFQDQILDIDEIDMIKSERTRRKRCEKLLEALVHSRNSSASRSLVKSMNRKYSFIASEMANVDDVATRNSDNGEATATKLAYSNRQDEHVDNVNTELESHDSHTLNETHVKTQDAMSPSVCATVDSRDNDTLDSSVSLSLLLDDGGRAVSIPMSQAIQNIDTELDIESQKRKSNKDTDSRIVNTSEAPPLLDNMPKDMAVIPTEASHKSRRLTVAFNYLSTLLNQGEFDKYDSISSRLRYRNPMNYDMLCIIGYLNASRDLFRTDFDSAKLSISSTMKIVPKTSNPRYFLLELFTAKTRMYITQKKLEKLQTTLDDAMMVLETDPGGCTGRAAGWLYTNNARKTTAQISCLNLSKPNALKLYESLFLRAKSSFQRAMNNFKMDGGKDGPFGFGNALCRLTILLLRCGDNGMTMGLLQPPEDDVNAAGQYLQHLEDSDVTIPKMLEVHYLLAKCDFQFRRNNFVRSLQHAEAAHDLATEINMLEFTEHAHNRVKYLRSAAPLGDKVYDVSEEEAQRILFGQSTDSLDTSQSE